MEDRYYKIEEELANQSKQQAVILEKIHNLTESMTINFRHNKESLQAIKIQTEKTNGRVTKAEDKLQKLELLQASCPARNLTSKLDKIEDETAETRVLNRNSELKKNANIGLLIKDAVVILSLIALIIKIFIAT